MPASLSGINTREATKISIYGMQVKSNNLREPPEPGGAGQDKREQQPALDAHTHHPDDKASNPIGLALNPHGEPSAGLTRVGWSQRGRVSHTWL